MRSRWERLGLRARITLLFALGGLLLSVTIAVVTLTLTRQNLLDEREDIALTVFSSNAEAVRNQLVEDPAEGTVGQIVASLRTTAGALPLVRFQNDWFAGTAFGEFTEAGVPTDLRRLVEEERRPATMRASIDGRPAIVSGIRLPARDAAYYEALPIDDVEDTLNALTVIILGASAATTALAAGLGSWASGRTLTPLVDVRSAAESLAAGELDTRLEPPADADLASLTASFNGMAQSLEDRIERDARFASEVSHELRSPLTTLNSSLEVLQNSRDQMPERSQTALGLLTDDVARFTQLVEDLLEISRYDVGSASLHSEPLGLAEFVRQAVSHSTRPDISVIASSEAEATVIAADKRRLAQVVANLIDNADKYGGGDIEVALSTWDETVLIAVEDRGPGVPAEEREVIFDRFSRGGSGGRRGYEHGQWARAVARRRTRGSPRRPGVGRRPPRRRPGLPLRRGAADRRSGRGGAVTRGFTALLVLIVGLAACSVPLDGSASPIPDEELPDTLRGSTTTTTTTMEPGPEFVSVDYFWVFQPEAEPKILQLATREVEPASTRGYLELAFAEGFLTDAEAETLVNAFVNWTLLSFSVDDDVATVDLAPLDLESQVSTEIVRDTAAQLVYFLAERGIDEVQLLINGEEESLPTGGAQTEPGDLISTLLYPLYAPGRVLPDPTTTTTAAPTSTTTTTAAPATTAGPQG